MKLYRTSANRWAGTQADAGKKGTWQEIDVPVVKADLIAFLNEMEERAEMVPLPECEDVDDIAIDVARKVSSPLNLAPLRHGAGWRGVAAGIAEAVALMDLRTALAWSAATVSRAQDLADGTVPVEVEQDNGDDLI